MTDPRFADLTVRDFVAATAGREPAPSGGVVAAVTAASGAALVAMGARFAGGATDALAADADALAARGLDLADEDARAYGAVLEALRLPAGTAGRDQRLSRALAAAADVPLALLDLTCEVARLGVRVAAASKPDLRGDVVTGVLLAAAAGRAAARLAATNLDRGDPDASRAERLRGLLATLAATVGELPSPPASYG